MKCDSLVALTCKLRFWFHLSQPILLREKNLGNFNAEKIIVQKHKGLSGVMSLLLKYGSYLYFFSVFILQFLLLLDSIFAKFEVLTYDLGYVRDVVEKIFLSFIGVL